MGTAGCENRSLFDTSGNVLPAATALGPLAVPVKLAAEGTGTHLLLDWPLSGAALLRTSSTSPSPSALWLPSTNGILVIGTSFEASVPVSEEARRFFRLELD